VNGRPEGGDIIENDERAILPGQTKFRKGVAWKTKRASPERIWRRGSGFRKEGKTRREASANTLLRTSNESGTGKIRRTGRYASRK